MDTEGEMVRIIYIFGLVAVYAYASGYDAYTSCYRTSRKRPDVPCNFGAQTWCTLPGNSYPWHAVKRFVQENQGLMKRMYGNERHLSVLRAELENNEIEYYYDVNVQDAVRRRYSKNMAENIKLRFRPNKAINQNDKPNSIHKNGISSDFKNIGKIPLGSTPLHTLPPNFISNNLTTTSASPTSATTEKIKESTNSLNTTESPIQSFTSQIELTTTNLTTARFNETQTENVDYVSEENPPETTNAAEILTTETGNETGSDDEFYEEVEEEDLTEEEEEEPVSQKVPSIVRLKGINACPVKEEVVAPYWANNTRGELLALLNLYPFEQYVHWERCTYEHKQMFCREGCRCEQQYRLHRLLAYDPNNECRGIFSDWFRFPSCCVCKCYDVPMEFRLTSRSPRSPIFEKLYKP